MGERDFHNQPIGYCLTPNAWLIIECQPNVSIAMKAAIRVDETINCGSEPSGLGQNTAVDLLLADLTHLAAQACEVSLAAIIHVENGQPGVVSGFGLEAGELAWLASLPLHSVPPAEICIVSDTLKDRRFQDDSLMPTARGIRFYAGVPLFQWSGEVLGILCVMDRKPRQLEQQEKEALWRLGRLASAQLASLNYQQGVEESLMRERNLSESTINSLPGIFYLFNEQGRFLRWNRNFERSTGYTDQEIADMHPLDFFEGVDREMIAERIQKVIEKGQSEVEAMMLSKGGKRTPYYFTGSLMEFHGQRCIIGMGIDITQRKRVEQRQSALSKLGQSLSSTTTPEEAARIIGNISEELFHWDAYALNLYDLTEQAMYPIINVDIIDGKRREITPTGEERMPSTRSLRILKNGAELILKEEPITMSSESVPFGDSKRPSASIMLVPVRNRTKDIGILSIHSYKVRAYNEIDLNLLQSLADHCGSALERIRTEAALKGSEMRFHSVWENSVEGMRLTDEKGMIVEVNQAFCRLVGIPAKEMVGKPFTAAYSETENLDQLLKHYRQRFQNQKVERMIERRLTFRNGKTVDLEVTNSVIEMPDNKRLVLGLFRDMTEHKRAEAELRKSEAELRLVWENSLDSMRLLDAEGTFLMVNEAYCHLVGKKWAELKGQPFCVVYGEDFREDFQRKYQTRLREKTIPQHEEKEVTLWNGCKIHLEATNSLLDVDGQPTLLLSTFRDITVAKRVQRKIHLLEQQRALEKERDRIARDMHDDVGGSLTRITLLTEIAEAELAVGKIIASEETKARLKKISSMSREVVRNLDEIVWAVDPGNDSLEKFASYTCHLAEELLKMTPINCRLDVPTLLPNYFLGSDVRHNLFMVVKESLNNVIKHSEASEVSLQMGIADTEISITISDNGRGFETDKLKPFSNGLSNMRNRMEKVGGKIKLKSQPGHGTTVALVINLEK
jgi:PAS domain S-box-containing protein